LRAPSRLLVRSNWPWLLPLGLVAYVVIGYWTSHFPDWRGVPTPATFLVFMALGLGAVRWRIGRIEPVVALAVGAIAVMLIFDATLFSSQAMRDFELYRKAGARWLLGEPVYLTSAITVRPDDLSDYPFLYPPLTLPLFGALAELADPISIAAWVGASVALLLCGLRLVGVPWRWALLLFLWPPVAQGLYVGNVALPLFVLFAAAPRVPAGLVVAPIFKLYGAITAFWLLRREHWRALLLGIAAVAVVALGSVLVVDPRLWGDWLTGLRNYQASQELLPNLLYGYGLGRYLPGVVYVAIAIVVTGVALMARSRLDQLARLGTATVAASPSLFSHGILLALPSFLRLDTPWFWLGLAITSSTHGEVWLAGLGLIVVSWFVPAMAKRAAADPWHPLGAATIPWPEIGAERSPDMVDGTFVAGTASAPLRRARP
jgi:hypothetical protein